MDFSKGTTTLERSDDLLTEILLRLPSKPIFKFTCVTKRWSTVINDHFFKKLYCERTGRSLTCSTPHGRLLGFVQHDNKLGMYFGSHQSPTENFMPVHGEEYVHNANIFPVEHGYFITCSKDGLFLYGRVPHLYYIGNPITGKWETLPPPPKPERFPKTHLSIGLSSNEEDDASGGKIINFRVIVLTDCYYVRGNFDDTPGVKVIPIETYSSKTREWRRSSLVSDIPVNIKYALPPTFSGGFFHWFTVDKENLVAYDPSSLDEEDENKNYNKKHVVQVIESPYGLGDQIIWRSDNGQTIWFGNNGTSSGIEVFRKCHNDDDWARICKIKLDTMKDLIGIPHKDDDDVFVNMIAFIPWDPKLILIRLCDKIYIYDCNHCIRKKVDEVYLDNVCHVTGKSWAWYPYFHSLSSSPFNFKDDHKP